MIKDIEPLPNNVVVRDLEFGEKVTKGGIIMLDDDGKEHGIHPRWAQVWRVGKNITEIKQGDWILIDHGRWTRTVEVENDIYGKLKVNNIDWPSAVLLVSETKPDNIDI